MGKQVCPWCDGAVELVEDGDGAFYCTTQTCDWYLVTGRLIKEGK